MQHLNGQGENFGNIQFVNETETIITGHGEYGSGLKRSAGDAGFDSDDGNDGSLSMSPSAAPGKKTRGRVKIEMKFIENKLRRYTTFSKRKTGIMKKAYELSTLTGTQVMLLVASETGHVYTFATKKLQPMITSESGKALIQTCLNSPDVATLGSSAGNGTQDSSSVDLGIADDDDRMNPGGFEETALNYNIDDDQPKTMVSGNGISISNSPSPIPLKNETVFPNPTSSDTNSQSGTPSPNPAASTPSTMAINSYLGPAVGQTAAATGNKPVATNMTMQLPAGFALLPTATPGISPISSSSVGSTSQSQPALAAQAVAMVSGSGGGQPVVYQTPQGMVYAAAGLPEGYVLNLPQTPTLAASTQDSTSQASKTVQQQQQQQQQPQQQPHFITIPVPVSLATGQVFQPFIAQQQPTLQQAQIKKDKK